MPDREKVIKGLECCTFILGKRKCNECPYQKGLPDNGCYQLQDDFHALLKEQEHKDRMYHALEDDWKRLKELLKEQEAVEPKTGHWIYRSDDELFMCSSCEKYSIRNDYPYCHWCGAKMKQEGRKHD